ncbi:hypothetical protein TPB0596_23050 [Tsukamurella pulmonis]|nr:hypothetical protein TPB0596_23050 [Tsukamurella pulmonis]
MPGVEDLREDRSQDGRDQTDRDRPQGADTQHRAHRRIAHRDVRPGDEQHDREATLARNWKVGSVASSTRKPVAPKITPPSTGPSTTGMCQLRLAESSGPNSPNAVISARVENVMRRH